MSNQKNSLNFETKILKKPHNSETTSVLKNPENQNVKYEIIGFRKEVVKVMENKKYKGLKLWELEESLYNLNNELEELRKKDNDENLNCKETERSKEILTEIKTIEDLIEEEKNNTFDKKYQNFYNTSIEELKEELINQNNKIETIKKEDSNNIEEIKETEKLVQILEVIIKDKTSQSTKVGYIKDILNNLKPIFQGDIDETLFNTIKKNNDIKGIEDLDPKDLKNLRDIYGKLPLKELEKILEKKENEVYLTENTVKDKYVMMIYKSIENILIKEAIEIRKKEDANVLDMNETSKNKTLKKFPTIVEAPVNKFPVITQNPTHKKKNNADHFISNDLPDLPEDKKNQEPIFKATISEDDLCKLYNSWGINDLEKELVQLKNKLESTNIGDLNYNSNVANINLNIHVIEKLIEKLKTDNNSINNYPNINAIKPTVDKSTIPVEENKLITDDPKIKDPIEYLIEDDPILLTHEKSEAEIKLYSEYQNLTLEELEKKLLESSSYYDGFDIINMKEPQKSKALEEKLKSKVIRDIITSLKHKFKNYTINEYQELSIETLQIIFDDLELELNEYSAPLSGDSYTKEKINQLSKQIEAVKKVIESKTIDTLIEDYKHSEIKTPEEFKKIITNFNPETKQDTNPIKYVFNNIRNSKLEKGKLPKSYFDLPMDIIYRMGKSAFKQKHPDFQEMSFFKQKLTSLNDYTRQEVIKDRLIKYTKDIENFIKEKDHKNALIVIQNVYNLVEEYSPQDSKQILKILNPLYRKIDEDTQEIEYLRDDFYDICSTETTTSLVKKLKKLKNKKDKDSIIEKKVIEKIIDERNNEYHKSLNLPESINIDELKDNIKLSDFTEKHERYSFLLEKEGIKFLKDYFKFYYENRKIDIKIAKETITREITLIANYIEETYLLNPELAKKYLKTIKEVKVLNVSLNLLSSEYKDNLNYIENSSKDSKNLIPEKLMHLEEKKNLPNLEKNTNISIQDIILKGVNKLVELIEFGDPNLVVSYYDNELTVAVSKSSSKNLVGYLDKNQMDDIKQVAIFLNKSGKTETAKKILMDIGMQDTIKELPSIISIHDKFGERENNLSGKVLGSRILLNKGTEIYNPSKDKIELNISKLLEQINNPIAQSAIEKNITELVKLDPENKNYEFLAFVYFISDNSSKSEKEKLEIIDQFLKNKSKFLIGLTSNINYIKQHDIDKINKNNIKEIIFTMSFILPENIRNLVNKIADTYKSTDQIKNSYRKEYEESENLNEKEKAEYNIILRLIKEEDFDNIKIWYQSKLKKRWFGLGKKKLHEGLAKKIYYLAMSYGDSEFANQIKKDFKLKNLIVDKKTQKEIKENKYALITNKKNKEELVPILRNALTNSEGVNKLEYMFKLVQSTNMSNLSKKDINIIENIFYQFKIEINKEIKEKYMTQEKKLLRFNKKVDILPQEYIKFLNNINELEIKDLNTIAIQRLMITYKVLMKDKNYDFELYKDRESSREINEDIRNQTKDLFLTSLNSIAIFNEFKNKLTTNQKIVLAELLDDIDLNKKHKILINYLLGEIRSFNEEKEGIIQSTDRRVINNVDKKVLEILNSVNDVNETQIKESDPYTLTALSYMSEDSKRVLESLNDDGNSPMFMVEEAIKIYNSIAEKEKSQSFFAYESLIVLFIAETNPIRNISQETVNIVLNASTQISKKYYDLVTKKIDQINRLNNAENKISNKRNTLTIDNPEDSENNIMPLYNNTPFDQNEILKDPLEYYQKMTEGEKIKNITKTENIIGSLLKEGRFVEIKPNLEKLKILDKNNTTEQILTIYLTALEYYKSTDKKDKKNNLNIIQQKTNLLVKNETLSKDDPLYSSKSEVLKSLESSIENNRLCLTVSLLKKYLQISTNINEINPDKENPFLTTEMEIDFKKNNITTSELKILIDGMSNVSFTKERNNIMKYFDRISNNSKNNTIKYQNPLLKLYFLIQDDSEELYPKEREDFFQYLLSFARSKESKFIKNEVNTVAERFKAGKELSIEEIIFFAFYGNKLSSNIKNINDRISIVKDENIDFIGFVKANIINRNLFPKIVIPKVNNS
jgi:hypothetical protein